MARRRRTWYSEQGTEERPSSIPGMVELSRAGKFIALVPATTPAEPQITHAEQDRMQRGNFVEDES